MDVQQLIENVWRALEIKDRIALKAIIKSLPVEFEDEKTQEKGE